jgi:hypothetical protein
VGKYSQNFIKEDLIVGYKFIQQSNNVAFDVYELVVDSPADLEEIPKYVGAGSSVVILHGENGGSEVRIKSPSGDWIII